MTRREEIKQTAKNKYPYIKGIPQSTSHQAIFIEAAEWADKTMIDKACDWIQCMALDYIQGDITDVKWESMFADLRNYIENGDD